MRRSRRHFSDRPREEILKSLITVGLKAVTPVLGGLIVAVLEEGGGILLDDRADARARDIHSRLLAHLEDHAKELVRAENLDSARLDYLLPTVERTLSRYGLRPNEWSEARFSAQQATEIILRRAGRSLKGLSDDDTQVIRSLVNAFHAALLDERDTLQTTEADFRNLVLDALERLPERTARVTAAQLEAAAELAAAVLIGLPLRPWRPGVSPPGALLRADIDGAVPFHGRRDEMAGLEAWCEGAASIGVRLYTGAGGMGKTRLFIEMCQRLRVRDWRAGFLDHRAAGAPAAVWSKLMHRPDPLFLVIDYAETRRSELVAALREALNVADGRRVRIVLLARAADDWWEQLKIEEGEGVEDLLSGPATRWFSLGPLALTMEDRAESYCLALRTFADRLNPENPPREDPPDDLGSEIFERVLLLHMSALGAVDGVAVKGDQGILDYTLKRERRFWSRRAKARNLSAGLVPGIAQAMAVLTLGGGARTREDAVAVFRQIPRLSDQDTAVLYDMSTLLHEAYPGAKWIEPILPDLLGEHLVQVEVKKDPDALFDLVFGAREAGTVANPRP
jgi:hypothetical protein